MRTTLRKLGFIVGGVQKAGTTALFSYLKTHPQLLAPRIKELHFFDDETIDWDNVNYSNLDDYYEPFSGLKIKFEITPIYLFWPKSIQRIHDYNDKIKLIFIFRDPIERAYSHWQMETNRGLENLSFSSAIREGRDRLIGHPQTADVMRIFTYVERGFYNQQLNELLSIFPKEQILLLSSDDLKFEHLETLKKITNFLEIDDFPEVDNITTHVGKYRSLRIDPTDVNYLRSLYFDEILEFQTRTPIDVSRWLTLNG